MMGRALSPVCISWVVSPLLGFLRSSCAAPTPTMQDPPATRMPPWRVGRMTPEAIQAATLELGK
jgi:hypothetical protein